MMDKLAGGSGGVGPVYHGREGDGATLALDMAVALRGPAGRGGASANKVYNAFHGAGVGEARPNAGAVEQAARAAGARREGLRRKKRAREGSSESTEEGGSEESSGVR
jgi:hypothetical protein